MRTCPVCGAAYPNHQAICAKDGALLVGPRRVPRWVWVVSVAVLLVPASTAIWILVPRPQPPLHPPKQLGPSDEGYWTVHPPPPSSSQPVNPLTFDERTSRPLPGRQPTPNIRDSRQLKIYEIERKAEDMMDKGRNEQAKPLLDQACTGGYGLGCFFLAMIYEENKVDAQDFPRAMALFSKACDAGYSTGCYYSGYIYENGYGVYGQRVAKDDSRAAAFYSKGKAIDSKACNEGN